VQPSIQKYLTKVFYELVYYDVAYSFCSIKIDFINLNKSQAKLEQLPASKTNFHQQINAVQSDTGTTDLQS